MPRYKLRTLLILLAIMPPLLAWLWPAVQRTLWPPVRRVNIRIMRVPDGGTVMISDEPSAN